MDFRDVIEFFKDTFKYFVVVIIVLLLFIFVVGLQQVVGPSMEPTLHEGNIAIVNKLLYRVGKIERNDIIVLMQDEKYMIKRVVGLPGEKVEYKDNYVFVNGEQFKEPFIDFDKVHTEDFSVASLRCKTENVCCDADAASDECNTIPEGMYIVLGDNRENSLDSRDYGLVKRKQIVGKVWMRVWPFKEIKFF